MGRAGLEKDLGGCAPDHHHPVAGVRRPEIADVLADGLGQVSLARLGLDIGAVEPPHVVVVEDGRHGLDLLQFGRDRLDMGEPVEHAAFQRGFVGRVRDRIPGTEDQLINAGQRHEVANERHSALSPLAEANGAHLSERAGGLSEAAPDQLDAGDHCRRHGAEPHGQHAQLAGGRLDVALGCLHGISSLQDDAALTHQRQQGLMPLRRDTAGSRPVFDGALALARQLRQRPETIDPIYRVDTS